MNKKQIYYILLLLGVVLIFGIAYFSLKNLSKNVIGNYKNLQEKTELLKEQNENESNLENNIFKLTALDEDNEKLTTKITEHDKTQNSISKINTIMKQSGVFSKELKLLSIEKVEIPNLEDRSEVYIYNISVLGEGNYNNILDFISEIENDSIYYKIENLSILPTDIVNKINISANISLFVVKNFELEKELILPGYEDSEDPFYYGE